MPSLVVIDLRGNKLYNLHTNIIQGCHNLEKFCLYGNLFSSNITLNLNGLDNLDQSWIFSPECWWY